ncbi:WecB/TagA/CpsF family glycosyltransferase [Sphingomonas sp. IW22]
MSFDTTASRDAAAPVSMIGPVAVAVLTKAQALDRVEAMANATGERIVAFCNAHSINLARRNPALRAAYDRALVLNDGVGLDIARRMLEGAAFPANLQGTDFTTNLLQHIRGSRTLFLLGSKPGVAQAAGDALTRIAPQHRVVGVRDGYFPASEDEAVAQEIARLRPDIVLIGMGQPRQEIWAARHAAQTGALVLCIGAYLDFVAGAFPRAPKIMRTMRAEWLFRLMLEPKRLFARYVIGNPQFLLGIANDRRRIKSR